MKELWIDRWNDRYSKDEFAYGEQPNKYLREQLEKLDGGTILFPAEGEGRMQFLQPNLVGKFQRLI